MSTALSKSFSELSLLNSASTPDSVFYMLGRFQPFTMGHMALFNNMILEASMEPNRHVYLFVSHKKPKFSRAKVKVLEQILEDTPTVKDVKPLMKKPNSIMDNPLTTSVRFEIVKMLMNTVYGKKTKKFEGEEVFILDKILDVEELFHTKNKKASTRLLDNKVEVHIVNSEITETGGFKAHTFLKKRYNKIPARMFTGTNREGRLAPFIMANKPIFVSRNEKESSDAYHPTSLSGSKIRSWSVIYSKTKDESMLENISNSYYGLLTNSKIIKYIVNPISDSIFGDEMVTEISIKSSSSTSSSRSSASSLSSSKKASPKILSRVNISAAGKTKKNKKKKIWF